MNIAAIPAPAAFTVGIAGGAAGDATPRSHLGERPDQVPNEYVCVVVTKEDPMCLREPIVQIDEGRKVLPRPAPDELFFCGRDKLDCGQTSNH